MALRITDVRASQLRQGEGGCGARTRTPASGGVDRESRPTSAEYTVTRCETCGQMVVALHDCLCGHGVMVHDVRGGRRTRCLTGLTGCGCTEYREAT